MSVILASLLNAYDSADATSYVTGSFSPQPGQPIYVEVVTYGQTTVPTIADSASQYTWTQRKTATTGSRVSTLFSAPNLLAPVAMTLTVTTGGGTYTGCHVSVVQGSGIDDSVNDGIVQTASATGSSTSLTGSLSAFGNPGNATLAIYSHVGANETTTPSGSLLTLTDSGGAGPTQRTGTMWQPSANTAPAASWATAGSCMMVCLEIKAAAQLNLGWPQLMPILAQ